MNGVGVSEGTKSGGRHWYEASPPSHLGPLPEGSIHTVDGRIWWHRQAGTGKTFAYVGAGLSPSDCNANEYYDANSDSCIERGPIREACAPGYSWMQSANGGNGGCVKDQQAPPPVAPPPPQPPQPPTPPVVVNNSASQGSSTSIIVALLAVGGAIVGYTLLKKKGLQGRGLRRPVRRFATR
jgi:hypothetical protein